MGGKFPHTTEHFLCHWSLFSKHYFSHQQAFLFRTALNSRCCISISTTHSSVSISFLIDFVLLDLGGDSALIFQFPVPNFTPWFFSGHESLTLTFTMVMQLLNIKVNQDALTQHLRFSMQQLFFHISFWELLYTKQRSCKKFIPTLFHFIGGGGKSQWAAAVCCVYAS